MAKFLAKAKYTAPGGVKGLIADGGSARVKAVSDLMTSVGGKLESFYFAFGEHDAYVVIDAPDNASVAAASLAIAATGSVHTKTMVLLTPEEIDQATKKGIIYQPPGH